MSLRSELEKVASEHWVNGSVAIKPLETEADLIYAAHECELTDEQRELVSPVWFYIGRAYLHREDHYPCIIYNECGERIGFISFSKWFGSDAYTWGYFIDKHYQGNGYGKQAARLAIQILKQANPEKTIKLATEASNTKAQKLYASLGFKKLAEMDGDDLVFGI